MSGYNQPPPGYYGGQGAPQGPPYAQSGMGMPPPNAYGMPPQNNHMGMPPPHGMPPQGMGMPPQGMGMPPPQQGGYPVDASQQSRGPPMNYPQQGYPQQGYPQQGQGYPQPGHPVVHPVASMMVHDGYAAYQPGPGHGPSPVYGQHAPIHQGVPPCSGTKKALLIGCNYFQDARPLRGCINDVKAVKSHLVNRWNFDERPHLMKVLTDDARDRNMLPTRANIIQGMKWLVAGARPGDSLFFHFSGHGSQVVDKDGDEDDGYDETICPCDYKRAGQIVDDMLYDILVTPLPTGCRLTAIFDSCHSGTALDLPYVYNANGQLIDQPSMHRGKQKNKTGKKVKDKGKVKSKVKDKSGKAKKSKNKGKSKGGGGGGYHTTGGGDKHHDADVIMFSGCRDNQTSADATIAGKQTGAMSHAFIKQMTQGHREQSFLHLLDGMRNSLKANGRFTQVPQMSSSRPMDMAYPFIM